MDWIQGMNQREKLSFGLSSWQDDNFNFERVKIGVDLGEGNLMVGFRCLIYSLGYKFGTRMERLA